MTIENLLRKVYRQLQNYTGETAEFSNINQTNLSGNRSNSDLNTNERLNINKSNPYNDGISHLYTGASENQLRKLLEEKDLKIDELRNIIEVILNNYFRFSK